MEEERRGRIKDEFTFFDLPHGGCWLHILIKEQGTAAGAHVVSVRAGGTAPGPSLTHLPVMSFLLFSEIGLTLQIPVPAAPLSMQPALPLPSSKPTESHSSLQDASRLWSLEQLVGQPIWAGFAYL